MYFSALLALPLTDSIAELTSTDSMWKVHLLICYLKLLIHVYTYTMFQEGVSYTGPRNAHLINNTSGSPSELQQGRRWVEVISPFTDEETEPAAGHIIGPISNALNPCTEYNLFLWANAGQRDIKKVTLYLGWLRTYICKNFTRGHQTKEWAEWRLGAIVSLDG